MKNTFGTNVCVTLFGESHGEAIGAVIDGLAPGIEVSEAYIARLLSQRRPSGAISTPRQEKDDFKIVSGVFNGKTTGTPICILIPNADTRSKDYNPSLLRPSHADFTANCKYHGYADYRGGGHFSGRITAATVAAGGIALSALEKKGILIGTHIKACGNISDRDFGNYTEDIKSLDQATFAVLDTAAGEKMTAAIMQAKSEGDSIGGVLETAVIGLDAGIGEPWFDTVEGLLAHAMFSIPAIKGIEFGAGFEISKMTGKTANDPFAISNGKIVTATNNSGGINGGITNGMPIIFRCACKPTPTIASPQSTVNIDSGEAAVLQSAGRHDPCIVHRARRVVDAMTALTLCDLLATHYGTDWLAK